MKSEDVPAEVWQEVAKGNLLMHMRFKEQAPEGRNGEVPQNSKTSRLTKPTPQARREAQGISVRQANQKTRLKKGSTMKFDKKG